MSCCGRSGWGFGGGRFFCPQDMRLVFTPGKNPPCIGKGDGWVYDQLWLE